VPVFDSTFLCGGLQVYYPDAKRLDNVVNARGIEGAESIAGAESTCLAVHCLRVGFSTYSILYTFSGGRRMNLNQVYTDTFQVSTKGETDITDITQRVAESVRKSGLSKGLVCAFVAGSTAGITTVEYEPGLIQDLQAAYEKIAPRRASYAHNSRWGDGNGYAHVRASFTGQDISVPFSDGGLMLGTWQQIILIDFDNRARTRNVIVQVLGE